MSKNKQDKTQQKKKPKKFKLLKIIMVSFLCLMLIASIAAAGIVLAVVKTSPKLDLNAILTLDEPSVLYYKTDDNNYEFMDEAPSLQKREVVDYNQLPENLINAVVSVEDERFWQHNGVDVKRIIGAVLIDVKKIIKNESGMQGASTITQQLLKNTILTNEFTLKRKIQEAYLAIELEKSLSKQQILGAYVNTIGLGGNINGVQKAAQVYFNKNVKDLDLIECAYIAGVTQNPSKYYAYSQKNQTDPTPYLDRTKTVLYTMHKNGYIDTETYNNAINKLDTDKKINFVGLKSEEQAHKLNYEWFSRPVLDAVATDLEAQYGYTAEETQTLIANGGLKIYTTMDKDLQQSTENIFSNNSNFGLTEAAKNSTSAIQPQASAVIMDHQTGEVKVIVGGRGEQQAASMNRATSSQFTRPTGSSLKPIAVYSAAIDSKKATAGTVIEDSPLSEDIGNQWKTNGKAWNPQNYSVGKFQGYITLREAIRRSTNLFAIKLEYQIGIDTGASYVRKFNIPLTDDESKSLAALSLGQIKGTNTLTMAAAYSVFGNEGVYTKPILYTKVEDKTGKVLLENKAQTSKVLSPQSAYVMYDLLKEPTSSNEGATGGAARFGSMPVAGKTGTTSDNKDFWFTGLTPYYSGAVWIGNDIPKTYGKPLSSSTAASVWSKMMAEAHKGLEVKDLTKPSSIVTASVCMDSGKIPTSLCSNTVAGNRVKQEIFIEGTIPTETCDVHVEAKINSSNGKLATENTPANLIESKVFLTRNYSPSATLADQIYVLPTAVDDTPKADPVVIPATNEESDKTDTTNPIDKNKDKKIKDTPANDNAT